MSGITGTQAELLYSLNAAVTKNTYTTQAVISAPAATAPVAKIPGGFLADNPDPVGRSFYLRAFGTIANTSVATFSMALGLDTAAGTPANAVTCFAATAPTAAVTAQWNLDVWYTCTAAGETGGTTLQVNGSYRQASVATGGVLNTTAWSADFAGTVTGLLSSTTYYVELLGTWNASAAGNTTTLQQMFFWGLN